MEIKITEKILAKCSLRYVKGESDKIHECYITPTKLYIHRKGDLETIPLNVISGIKLTQRLNWVLIMLGVLFVIVALCNYKYGLFLEKDFVIPESSQGDMLIPLDQLENEAQMIKTQKDWEDDNGALSFWIGAAGIFLLSWGFKKRSYLQILTNAEVILLRVYTITEEYAKFYAVLDKEIGAITSRMQKK